MSWLTDREAFRKYPLRSAAFLDGYGFVAAVATGAVVAAIVPLALYRRFGRK